MEFGLDVGEPVLKFVVGPREGVFRAQVEEPGEVDQGKEQVSEFFLEPPGIPG